MQRRPLSYRAGNENNPCDPIGRTELALDSDGGARLDHHARGGVHHAWTGRVAANAMDRLWSAIDRSSFPIAPPHRVPADATIRILVAGVGDASESMYIEWDAATKVPGFDEAFAILDAAVRQLSEDTLKHVPAGDPGMISDVVRIV